MYSNTVCGKANYSLSHKTVNTRENFNQMRDETAEDNRRTAAGISHHLIQNNELLFFLKKKKKTSVSCVNVLLIFIRMLLSAALDHCTHLQTQMTLTCLGKLTHQRNCVSHLHITLYYHVCIEHF